MPLTNWARASVAFELNDAATTEKHAALALAQSRAVRQSGTDLSSAVREAPAYNLLGLARRALGDDRAALEAYDEGLRVDPDSFELLSNAASLLVDHDDYDRATQLFTRAVELQPNSAEVLNNFGFFLERKGDLDAALDHYLRAQQALLPASHPQIDTNVRNVQDRIRNGGVFPEPAGVLRQTNAEDAPRVGAVAPQDPRPPQQQRAPETPATKPPAKPAYTWQTSG